MLSLGFPPLWLAVLQMLLFVQLSVCDPVLVSSGTNTVKLAGRKFPKVKVIVAKNEIPGVARAAGDLALDFGRVIGVNGSLIDPTEPIRSDGGNFIIAGTIGNSTIIDGLVSQGKLDVASIKGKWESYVQQVIKDPIAGVSSALVIAGSDKRGAIYGIYDVSETIGVSPWYFFADVPPRQRDNLYLDPTQSKIQGPPSIKYRGIFINDEWELIAWSKNKYPQSPRGTFLTSTFYAQVFELLLRCKANYLWPGMKSSEAFYIDDLNNGVLADSYGIIMGTSHHEPMARAYAEQVENVTGPWDWSGNRDNIIEFMRQGAARSKNWETMYTMAMRGAGEDKASSTLTSSQIEDIIQVQQQLLSKELGKAVPDILQVWALYKEVGKYWEAGMNISEHVTLLWTDDNFGNLQRIPLVNETSRIGGAGIYYHFGYVGYPRTYEWTNPVQFVKTWEQMQLAYQKQARRIWICNVQDIKGFEVPMSHFLDMAYDMNKHETPQSTTDWLKRWASREFNSGVANTVAEIFNTYGRLILRRRYETMNMQPFVWSTINYDEATRVLAEWEDLVALIDKTYNSFGPNTKIAFYELVVYPIKCGKYNVELWIKNELGKLYKTQQRTSTNLLAGQVIDAFKNDAKMTATYHSQRNKKWNRAMGHPHIGYSRWLAPSRNILPSLSYISDADAPQGGLMGVAVQGSTLSSTQATGGLVMVPMDPYMPKQEQRYIDVFATNNGTFSYHIKSNASYVSISNPTGTIATPDDASDARSFITVDWAQAPPGLSWVKMDVTRTGSSTSNDSATVLLPVNKTSVPSGFTGYVESNGVVSIEAEHYAQIESKNGVSYTSIPYYGRTLSGLKLWPVTAPSQTSTSGPKARYNFFTFNDVPEANLIVMLGASLDHDPTRPLTVAWSLDGGKVTKQRVFPHYQAGSLPVGWTVAVITSGWNITAGVQLNKGQHSLKLGLLEPGVVVEKIILDLGGMKYSGLGPPESAFVSTSVSKRHHLHPGVSSNHQHRH